MKKTFIEPRNQVASPHYTNAISIQGGRTLYISGQTAYNEKYEFLGGDFSSQVDQSLKNLLVVLNAADATPANVISIRMYIKNYHQSEHLAILMHKIKKFFLADQLPTSTLIGVQSLALDILLFEIEAIAILPL